MIAQGNGKVSRMSQGNNAKSKQIQVYSNSGVHGFEFHWQAQVPKVLSGHLELVASQVSSRDVQSVVLSLERCLNQDGWRLNEGTTSSYLHSTFNGLARKAPRASASRV